MAKTSKKERGDSNIVSGSVGAENLGLPRPYGSAPLHPGEYCLYVTKGNGFMTVIVAATYVAKKFLDILLEDDEISYVRGISGKNDTIVSSTGIKVRCDKIKEIHEHEYSKKEEEWVLNEPECTNAARFRMSSHERGEERVIVKKDEVTGKVERVKKEPKASRPSKEGLITIQQICEELKMEPREARGILRKMKTVKPDVGWAWAKSQVDEIKTLLNNNK